MLESFDFLFSTVAHFYIILHLISSSGNYTLNAYKRKYLFYRILHMQAEVVFKHKFTKVQYYLLVVPFCYQALSAAAFTLVTPLKTRLHSDFTKKGFVLF